METIELNLSVFDNEVPADTIRWLRRWFGVEPVVVKKQGFARPYITFSITGTPAQIHAVRRWHQTGKLPKESNQ